MSQLCGQVRAIHGGLGHPRRWAIAGLAVWSIWVASPAGAAATVWESFVDPAFVGNTSGPDLLVGTADDVPAPNTTGFNSTGSLSHLFFIDPGDGSIPAAASYTDQLIDNTGLPLGTGATMTDFEVAGRDDDDVFLSSPRSSPRLFRDLKKEDERLADALAVANEMVGILVKKAREGDRLAAETVLNRIAPAEKDTPAIAALGIKIQLPDSVSTEEWARIVDVTPQERGDG